MRWQFTGVRCFTLGLRRCFASVWSPKELVRVTHIERGRGTLHRHSRKSEGPNSCRDEYDPHCGAHVGCLVERCLVNTIRSDSQAALGAGLK